MVTFLRTIGCCDIEQGVMIGIFAFLALCLCLSWHCSILKPLKLFAVLMHELGCARARGARDRFNFRGVRAVTHLRRCALADT